MGSEMCIRDRKLSDRLNARRRTAKCSSFKVLQLTLPTLSEDAPKLSAIAILSVISILSATAILSATGCLVVSNHLCVKNAFEGKVNRESRLGTNLFCYFNNLRVNKVTKDCDTVI